MQQVNFVRNFLICLSQPGKMGSEAKFTLRFGRSRLRKVWVIWKSALRALAEQSLAKV